jgi:hypothetical protein
VDFEDARAYLIETVKRYANRGAIPQRVLDREQRRTLERTLRETEKEWRAGRPVQRKQALQVGPLIWRELYGLPISQTPPEQPILLMHPLYPGHEKFAEMVAESAMIHIGHGGHYDMGAGVVGDAIESAVHSALYPVWLYMRASQMSDPSVLNVKDSLVEKLMNTDIGANVSGADIRLPFPGIYVSMPFGEELVQIRNSKTGLHEITLMGIAEGRADNEREFFCIFWGEPRPDGREPGDDHVYSFRFSVEGSGQSLSDEFKTVDTAHSEQLRTGAVKLVFQKDMVRFYDQPFDFIEGRNLLRRLVVNLCLYLNSPNPDITPTKSNQGNWSSVVQGSPKRTRVRVSKKRRSSKKDKVQLSRYEIWNVGDNIKKLERKSSATDVLVRGHFRNQPYGKARSLRRVIWIEPFIRLPSGPDRSPGHEYDIESNA